MKTIHVATVVSGGQYVYTFTNETEKGMLEDLAEYCRSNWSHQYHLEGEAIPEDVDEIIDAYFDNGMDEEDDWYRTTESKLCP